MSALLLERSFSDFKSFVAALIGNFGRILSQSAGFRPIEQTHSGIIHPPQYGACLVCVKCLFSDCWWYKCCQSGCWFQCSVVDLVLVQFVSTRKTEAFFSKPMQVKIGRSDDDDNSKLMMMMMMMMTVAS